MEVKIPEIAENVERAEVARVLVSVGDSVSADQPLLELEADKASFELPSPVAGRVDAIHVEPGDEVAVGQPAVSVSDGDATDEGKARAREPEPRRRRDEEQRADEKRAEEERAEEERAEEERAEGKRAEGRRAGEERQRARADGGGERRTERAREAAEPARPAEREGARPPRAAPTTRKLARELGVDLRRVPPAADGRITADAVKAFVRERGAGAEAGDTGERRRLSRLRRTASERLSRAWRNIPHVTQHELVDVTELEEARRRYEARRAEDGVKLTLSALVARATISALSELPTFNSRYDEDRQELVLSREVHLGVAVDTERGLLVPVIRDAGRLSLGALAARIAEAAAAARGGHLEVEDLRGASFSITNLGGIGGSFFTPIINPPEVAILGVGRARRGVYAGVEERRLPLSPLLLPLSLSYDHRVIDGADAVRFIVAIARRLRDPFAILMDG